MLTRNNEDDVRLVDISDEKDDSSNKISTFSTGRLSFISNDPEWLDCGKYWLHRFPQLTPEWYHYRREIITSTLFNPIVNPSFIRGHDDVVRYYGDNQPRKKSLQEEIGLRYGLENEPKARLWYEQEFNVKVEEVGLAIPKWDTRLGASIDGQVVGTAGIIEIKCPGHMYGSLLKEIGKKEGRKEEDNNNNLPKPHIFRSHYDQMQGAMAITNKEWCDYIVYCQPYDQVYVERIDFNGEYWKDIMYPRICNFLDDHPELFGPVLPGDNCML